ncbi:pentapeptide repeat-containing protein [Nocardia brasiliensis]|uniref:Pentapeptide repeat-containing protein n=1 Tax=Nocardia brasiliensis TaxID=37326 RepID=A0A6G9XUG5_NOCBR|nr:pentapeptide repeat-containing protein [Nocardia brasiliensis]QIS04473.1 pentapeptide repeat-containing protein [Nocardia brasiliensis]
MARELGELSYARYLTALAGELEPEGDYDCVHVDGLELEDADVRHARFGESAFTSVAFHRGSMRHTRFADVWLRNVRWVGTELADTSWLDGELIAGALSGVDFAGARLRRVRFEGCKFDAVNFRTAQLREVSFVECVLRDCDFGDAALHTVTFPGSTLHSTVLRRATLTKVDLRGARALDITEGLDALRGATIDNGQLMELAPALAQHLGIIVRDS